MTVEDPAPADRVETLDGSVVTFEMIGVAGGRVTLPDGSVVTVGPFLVGKTEVTWDLYDIFAYRLDEPEAVGDDGVTRPSKPYIAMDRGFGHAGYPVISVSARGAVHFCEWLSGKTGRTYRLPTLAEWQYLCGASGVDADSVDGYAWHSGNAGAKTHAVGSREADRLGLHDLLGNASEWCEVAPGRYITAGGTYRDSAAEIGCGSLVESDRSWNESDPQFPKSEWWFADAGWVGFRVVCESE